jgi:2-methylisocitrate lyase-like PEP mutase family enzyme
MATQTKTATLRRLIARSIVAMPGVPNASMARQVERAGFDAVYISGAGWRIAPPGCRMSGCSL